MPVKHLAGRHATLLPAAAAASHHWHH